MSTVTKRRIHQVAKEFNISNEALIAYLTKLNYDIRGPMTALSDEMYEAVSKKYRKEPEPHDANYEFRKRLRDKKAEEEKERERARHDIEQRLRVTSKLTDRRTRKAKPVVEVPVSEAENVVPVPVIAPRPEIKERVAEVPEVAPRVEPEKPVPAVEAKGVPVVEDKVAPTVEAKPVPSLHDTIAALIPKEDLRQVVPPPAEAAPASPAPPAKKAEKTIAEAATKKKRKRKRRKKKKAIVVEMEPEEELAARLVKEKDKAAKKPKKRKKRKISDEEIEESIRQTLAAMEGISRPKPFRRRRAAVEKPEEEAVEEINRLKVPEFVSAADLARLMEVEPSEVIRKCLDLGMVVSINQRLDGDVIQAVADEFGYQAEIVHEYGSELIEQADIPDPVESLAVRPPVVTIMGHVDHGKTSLLDYIRESNIAAGEHGGITQHIGAYVVEFKNRSITFLDTPGHEAFTAMRARGAQATDIVILVVAADDGVQNQTIEAINHARAAGVPIVVAINKIDKATANPDLIKQQLAQHGILVESWGGKYQSAEISAKTGKGVENLLELVLLEADLRDLKANPHRRAKGVIIEAELDKGKGPVATVLVQNGTLNIGDPFLAGQYYGRVRAMYDEWGRRVTSAPPSTPVRVVGFSGVPTAGDTLVVMESEREAKEISLKRQQLKREHEYRKTRHVTLDQISQKIKEGEVKELRLIVKGDVDGSVEALSDSLLKLSNKEVTVNVIHKAVGGISESDVLLAAASDAIIIGFNIRATQQARAIAERENVDIRNYKIIYDAVNDVKAALEGLLEPEISEQITGTAEVRKIFRIPKVGTVAGCYVQSGKITRSDHVRLYRNDKLIFDGKIASLKRVKDDVREVAAGFECGLGLESYDDIHENDVIETYQIIKTKRTL
ncbi:MAG: translation initiation factor IF-2 [candidate division KSB1 bacterium]|nr:translation initiation factor IF-2 [candidate division KSB1 bacterium]MDZ7303494.1 translation initiation factor IF-2 [candidate division KSB1 bacterium]MDZ7312704.1 translation initiation factor IF-2 [candidate division KSB1 bacterium]